MKTYFILFVLFTISCNAAFSQNKIDSILPVRGICMSAPQPKEVNEFLKFIENELVPRKINTLIMRIEYNYRYASHPELSDSDALSKQEIKKMVSICKKHSIRLIPSINLFGNFNQKSCA